MQQKKDAQHKNDGEPGQLVGVVCAAGCALRGFGHELRYRRDSCGHELWPRAASLRNGILLQNHAAVKVERYEMSEQLFKIIT